MKETKTNNPGEIEVTAMKLGETIAFDDVLLRPVTTKFGETHIASFANMKGEIFKKVWANDGLAQFLKMNSINKSVTLKKVLTEGVYKYNIYE